MSEMSMKDIDRQNEKKALECITILHDLASNLIKECIEIQDTCRSVKNALRNNGRPNRYLRNPSLTNEQEAEVDRFCENQENAKREQELEHKLYHQGDQEEGELMQERDLMDIVKEHEEDEDGSSSAK